MSLKHLIKYAFTLQLKASIGKTLIFLKRQAFSFFHHSNKQNAATFGIIKQHSQDDLNKIIKNFDFTTLIPYSQSIIFNSKNILNHYFDLLGTGEQLVAHGVKCRGFLGNLYDSPNFPDINKVVITNLNKGNRKHALLVRQLISKNYKPIDWQLDFKSGFRWKENTPSRRIMHGHLPGVDIKIPWELARFQHLHLLAFSSWALAHEEGKIITNDKYKTEFCDQILDFIAANPPAWGVNWVCPMDVGIRATNIIIAFNLFLEIGHTFDARFISELTTSLNSHGAHIIKNLEWHSIHRNNHYLGNIIGLLFIGAFLPESQETRLWLVFGIQELINETKYQFLTDGANFEASTSYHRLSAEMVTLGTAIVLGLSKERKKNLSNVSSSNWSNVPPLNLENLDWKALNGPFPSTHFDILQRIANFSMRITKPNGVSIQIGDNDNGRILDFTPSLPNESKLLKDLTHFNLIAGINGIINHPIFSEFDPQKHLIETTLIQSLTNLKNKLHIKSKPSYFSITNKPKDQIATYCKQVKIKLPDPSVIKNLHTYAFSEFGIFIWQSDRFFLAVRCGPIGQNGNGGHAHNDQLSIELQIDGIDWIVDPGTFIYSADAKLRDLYRSVFAHATPRFYNYEPSKLTLGMFKLENNAHAECLEFNEKKFRGIHEAYKQLIFRNIEIKESFIEITDGIGGNTKKKVIQKSETVYSPEELQTIFNLNIPFSRSYGVSESELF